MRRVSVVGNSGSGKTALAQRLAAALDVEHVELDAIFHQPGWIELPHAEFRQRVEVALGADGWVVDGNYSAVRDLVWAAADTVVWLDLPRRVVMSRVIRRTITRAVTRRELWNGNREPLVGMFRRDPRENIVLWSWTNHGEYARRYASAATDPANAHLAFIRVSSHDDANRLVASRRHESPLIAASRRYRTRGDVVIPAIIGQGWQCLLCACAPRSALSGSWASHAFATAEPPFEPMPSRRYGAPKRACETRPCSLSRAPPDAFRGQTPNPTSWR